MFFLNVWNIERKREKPWGLVSQIRFSFGKFSVSDKLHNLTQTKLIDVSKAVLKQQQWRDA